MGGGCNNSALAGADGTAIGTGAQNTIDIETGCTAVGTAADLCANLTLDGYTDWFLPSEDELNQMWTNLADSDGDGSNTGPSDPNNLGGFVSHAYSFYWSSTQYDNQYARRQGFRDGSRSYHHKSDPGYVRAVRAF